MQKKEIVNVAFEALNLSKIPYCGVGLPSKLLSPEARDIDLFVSLENLESLAGILTEAHESFGWEKIKEIKNEYSLQLFYSSSSNPERSSRFVQWDLMPWSSWRGIRFVDATEMIEHRLVEEPVVYLDPCFQKDYKSIRSLLCKPSNSSLTGSPEGFSEWKAQKLHLKNPNLEGLDDKQVRRIFYLKSLCKNPMTTFLGVYQFFYYYLRRFLSPPGMVLGLVSKISSDDFDEEVENLVSQVPISGATFVLARQWNSFRFRMKILRRLFLGDVVVVSEYPRKKSTSGKWRGLGNLFAGRVDRIVLTESDASEKQSYFLREIILEVFGERVENR